MLRLETADLSRAEEIIRHPAIVEKTGVAGLQRLNLVGDDRSTILIMDDDEPVGYIGFWLRTIADGTKEGELGTGVLPGYRARSRELVPLYQAVITTIFILGAQRVVCQIQEENFGAVMGARVLGFDVISVANGTCWLALSKHKWYTMHPKMRQ